jgi:sulfur carrier protein ThiS
VKVLLRNPTREVDVDGPIAVTSLVERLGFHRDAVLVISDGELVPGDARLDDSAVVEIRPVISGG